jgi:hypothetical protein
MHDGGKKQVLWSIDIRWLIIGLICIILGVWGIIRLVPFLSCNRPVDAEVLIVEGWLAPSYVQTILEEFHKGKYHHLFVVGDCQSSGQDQNVVCNTKSAVQRLIQLGIEPSLVTAVIVRPTRFHTTWSYALALQDYMAVSGYEVKTANVLSLWVHARKSLVLFQKAFGPDVKVGVIAVRHQRFSSEHWWLSARGIYAVVKNSVAYLDALFLTGRGKHSDP